MSIILPANLVTKAATEGLTVCFTGPRPKNLHGYDKERYNPIVDMTESVCRELVGLGVKRFISGGAQGFDQLAFWAVDRLRRDGMQEIANEVYVPFAKQPSIWAPKGLFSQQEYRTMLSRATDHRILAADPVNKGETVARLHGRNHSMVGDSDIVVALLSDRSLNWRTSSGGTAECVRYARNVNKPVLTIQYRPELDPQCRFAVEWAV